jgi:pimeloyl-ACP methyl ester carboxylesterase
MTGRTRFQPLIIALLSLGCDGDEPEAEADVAEEIGETRDTASTDLAGADLSDAPDPLETELFLEDGPFGRRTHPIELEDTTRVTPENGTEPERPTRFFETMVLVPTTAEDGTEPVGPHPLVLYAHGFLGSRTDNQRLLNHLVTHGYVAAAMDFPLTNLQSRGGPNVADIANQPADVSFVIDELLAMNEDPESFLFGLIDPDRIGIAGVSLGGMTGLLVGYFESLRDSRIAAVGVVAAPTCYLPRPFFDGSGPPLLLVHGDIDVIVPYEENAPPAFAEASTPKFLVTIAGATHTGFADQAYALFSGLDNADIVGCESIIPRLPMDQLDDLAQEIVGPLGEAAGEGCTAPCDYDELPVAGPISFQADVLFIAFTAFFNGYLKDDSLAIEYLSETLDGEFEEISVEHGLQ